MRVEGLLKDRKISRKLKGKALLLAYLCNLEMVALTETTMEVVGLWEWLGREGLPEWGG